MFPDTDAAMEWCEEAMLAADPDTSERTRFALSRLDVFSGLSREECRLLEGIVQAMHFEKGEVILREGDPARLFFVVARGSVTVSLAVGEARRKRIACIGPGLTFGEMALLDGGPRSADVIADEGVICYGLAVEAVRELSVDHPNVLTTILANLSAGVLGPAPAGEPANPRVGVAPGRVDFPAARRQRSGRHVRASPTSRSIVRLRPQSGRPALLRAPWFYVDEVVLDRRTRAIPAGAVVAVEDSERRPLGCAAFNAGSKIALRLLDSDPAAEIDVGWFAARLSRALALRELLFDAPFYRLVHAEADGLPGVVIDRYGDAAVIQPNAAWADVAAAGAGRGAAVGHRGLDGGEERQRADARAGGARGRLRRAGGADRGAGRGADERCGLFRRPGRGTEDRSLLRPAAEPCLRVDSCQSIQRSAWARASGAIGYSPPKSCFAHK